MRKVFYLSTALLLTACGGDSLTDIQNQKIKGSELTWLSAINQFSYCIDSTKIWELKEDTEQRAVALFSCDVPQKFLPQSESKVESAVFSLKVIHNKIGKAKKYAEFSITERIIFKYDDNNSKSYNSPGYGTFYVRDNINPTGMMN